MEEPTTPAGGPVGPAAGNLSGLEQLLKAKASAGMPPVELWNPPYCGDIGLRIEAGCLWTYQGSPIGRKPLVKLFSSVLRKDADGRTYLVTPVEKIDVFVADAHFMAVEMWASGHGRDQSLSFRTHVDDIVTCGPAHPLRYAREEPTGGLKPYVLVRGRLEALVTRSVYYDLVALAVTEPGDGGPVLGVWSGGAFFAMAPAAAAGESS